MDRVFSGENLEMFVDGNQLVIKTDISKVTGKTKKGDSDRICTTYGTSRVNANGKTLKIGLNVTV